MGDPRLAQLAERVRFAGVGVACAMVERAEAPILHLSPAADEFTADSMFEIGSITKTITGLLLAVLVERGVVCLADPIGRWVSVGLAEDITLEELATHTSGLPRVTPTMIERARASVDDPYRDTTVDDVLDDVRRANLCDRGLVRYSNAGYMLLGHVLSVAAGRPYEELVKREVFTPLGMTAADFGDRATADRVPGYRGGRATPRWRFQLNAAGGVEASLRDMAAYASANVYPAATTLAPAIDLAQEKRADGDLGGGGLGWRHRDGVVWHSGATGGFGSFIGIDRAARNGVVILTNAEHQDSLNRAGFDLLRTLRDDAR